MFKFGIGLIVTALLASLVIQGVSGARIKRFLNVQQPDIAFDTGSYHWTKWSSWSHCHAKCDVNGGVGQQSRKRHCNDGEDDVDVRHCHEPNTANDEMKAYIGNADIDVDIVMDDGSTTNTIEHEYKSCVHANCPVNGGWSNWGDFGACSVTTGSGHMLRHRQCNNPAPEHGGHNCIGSSTESKSCSVNTWSNWEEWTQCSVTCGTGIRMRSRHCTSGTDCIGQPSETETCTESSCSINGEWSAWAEFGKCSRSCGTGVTFRTRLCNNPSPQNGGENCTGNAQELKACFNANCQIDGGWSAWTAFGKCSRSCGTGVTFRTRLCNNPGPQNGGQNCFGNAQELKTCFNANCPIDGEWSGWTEFGKCSRSCGTGVTFRTRLCNNPSPQNGGQNCTGYAQELKECFKVNCPIDGGWSDLKNFSCSTTCGNGLMTSYRTCTNPAPNYGGKNCSGEAYSVTRCNLKNCVVNKWSDWSAWSACDTTCNTGSRSRTRSCLSENDCIGESNQTEACNLNPCPIDGGWSDFRDVSCSVTCGVGQEIALRECTNPTPQFGGKDCVGLSHQITVCEMPSCVINGGWSEWSNVSHCESICGDGHFTQNRTCSNPTPQNGGQNCTGSNVQTLSCNNGPCPSEIPICNKATVLQDVQSNALFAPTRAGPCSNMDFIPEENMLKDLCGAPADATTWSQNLSIKNDCKQIPLYSPIMKLHRQYNTRNYGILLDCENYKMKIATETCEDGVHEQFINLEVEDDWEYFTLKWK